MTTAEFVRSCAKKILAQMPLMSEDELRREIQQKIGHNLRPDIFIRNFDKDPEFSLIHIPGDGFKVYLSALPGRIKENATIIKLERERRQRLEKKLLTSKAA